MNRPMATRACDHCGALYQHQRSKVSRFCSRLCHHTSRIRQPESDRFWRYVEKASDNCWYWRGAIGKNGYGRFSRNPIHLAHRWAYEAVIGAIPDGLQLDHLCRHRDCVNPAHLEPVTNRQNWERGASPSAVAYRTNRCNRGHEFTPENTIYFYRGAENPTRGCRLCDATLPSNRRRRRLEVRP